MHSVSCTWALRWTEAHPALRISAMLLHCAEFKRLAGLALVVAPGRTAAVTFRTVLAAATRDVIAVLALPATSRFVPECYSTVARCYTMCTDHSERERFGTPPTLWVFLPVAWAA